MSTATRARWYVGYVGYVGYLKGGRPGFEAFTCDHEPTRASHGDVYCYCVGPFLTKRAAVWAEEYGLGNPHFVTVHDAEAISRDPAACAR